MKRQPWIRIVANSIIWIIFALSLLTVILSLNTTTEGIPNIFGTGYLTVQSDSMSGVFEQGDAIIVKTVEAVPNGQSELFDVGDVITFNYIIGGEQVLNTHEIVSYRAVFTNIGDTTIESRYYTTRGTNPNIYAADDGERTINDIKAVYTGIRLRGVGTIIDYIQSSTGFLICVVLPLAAIFIYQIVNFAMLLAKYRTENKPVAAVDVSSLTAEQQAEIAKKYLESLNAKKEEDKS